MTDDGWTPTGWSTPSWQIMSGDKELARVVEVDPGVWEWNVWGICPDRTAEVNQLMAAGASYRISCSATATGQAPTLEDAQVAAVAALRRALEPYARWLNATGEPIGEANG